MFCRSCWCLLALSRILAPPTALTSHSFPAPLYRCRHTHPSHHTPSPRQNHSSRDTVHNFEVGWRAGHSSNMDVIEFPLLCVFDCPLLDSRAARRCPIAKIALLWVLIMIAM
ncbi:hypothetical protein BD779DRAFT_173030 [Infundibulicybe gibba]|nr:hypothetical protein BD779DRAFT_173030 [Infundibulicybe gibba]